MKTNTNTADEFKPVFVYRDLGHEQSTKNNLEVSRGYMQNLYDQFMKMKIGEPADLTELLNRTQIVYDRHVNAMVETPKTTGRFGVNRDAYKSTLDLPNPAALFAARESAIKQMFCAVPGLWTVKNGRVTIVDEIADVYINALTLIAKTEKQADFVAKLNRFCNMWNEINESVGHDFTTSTREFNSWASGKFKIENGRIEFSRETVERWMMMADK